MVDTARTTPGGMLADFVFLVSVGVLLYGIHVFLPPALQDHFVFRQALDRPVTLLTAAYLHANDQHLYGNLIGYGAMASFTYFLCAIARERRWFRFTTLSMVFVIPILVNLSSMVVWQSLSGGEPAPWIRGFSGVVAGFGGFFAISLLVWLRTRYSRYTVRYVGVFLLLVVLGELLLIYTDSPPLRRGTPILLGLVLIGFGIIHHAYPSGLPRTRADLVGVVGSIVVIAFVVWALSILVYGMFPSTLVDNGSVTNVFAHVSGLVWGVVVSRWGYRYWAMS